MPDLLSDFKMPTSYRQVAVSRITNTATLYSTGSSNTVGIVEVVGSGATTDLSLAMNESVSDVSYQTGMAALTLYAGRGVRDSAGKWSNYMRMRAVYNGFVLESFPGNGHKDGITTAYPIAISINGNYNVSFGDTSTVFLKNVIFNGDVQIAGYQKIVYSAISNTTANTVFWIPLHYFTQVPEAIYVGRIELYATDANNNYLIWSSVGTLLLSRTNQEVYGASPGNLLSVNWFSHHRTIAMPTVEYIPGTEMSPGYGYGTLRLTFSQAVKAVINFSLKRLM